MGNGKLIFLFLLHLIFSGGLMYTIIKITIQYKHQFILLFAYFLMEFFSILFGFCTRNKGSNNELIEKEINNLSLVIDREKECCNPLKDDEKNSKSSNKTKTQESEENSDRKSVYFYDYILPGFLDFCDKFCLLNGFILYGKPSIFQGIAHIVVSFIAFLFLERRKLNFTSYIGYLLSSLGCLLITLMIYLWGKNNEKEKFNDRKTIIYLCIILIGTIPRIILYYIQKHHIKHLFIPIYKESSFEGLFGLAFAGVCLVIASFLKCPSKMEKICVNKKGKIENYTRFYKDIKHKPNYFYYGGFVLCSLFNNFIGNYVIKHSSVSNRVIIENCILGALLIVFQYDKKIIDLSYSKKNLIYNFCISLILLISAIFLMSEILFCKCLDRKDQEFDEISNGDGLIGTNRKITTKEEFIAN